MFARPLVMTALLALLATALPFTVAQAKTPGKTYCFNGICHRVLTLSETSARVGKKAILSSSHYDSCKRDRFNPCGLTSSGEVFNADRADNAASPILPNGTIVMVRYPATGKTAVLRINNAGPYYGRRLIDVSRGTAETLGFKTRGVVGLEISVLQAPSKAEATYKRNRSYAKVPGYLGQFASIDAAGARYAALTAPKGTPAASTAVAAIYPQGREGLTPQARPAINGNGIERTWLAQGLTFKPTAPERRWAKVAGLNVAKAIAPPRARASR